MKNCKLLHIGSMDFDEKYLIYSDGRIINKNTGKFIKVIKNNKYCEVNLYYKNSTYHYMLHRLVALHFLENPNNYSFIGFKDGDYHNCNCDNLFWKEYKNVNTKEEYIRKEKERHIRSVLNRRKVIKERAVQYKGGKCCICGYNRCIAALEFHHLNPEDKDFQIANYYTKNWEIIKSELDKCILVCANCHRELENGIIIYKN